MRLFSRNLAAAFAGAVALVALSAASDASTVNIFSTGVDDSGNALAVGSADTHYTSTGPTTVYSHPAYLPNDAVGTPGSAWLGGNSFPADAGYTVHFTLTETFDAILTGSWAVDNQAFDILINGNSTGISLLGIVVDNFNQLHTFTTTAAQSAFFLVGDNILTFRVHDDGNPGAFRAAGLSVTTTPIPGALLLFGSALGGMGFLGFRKKKAEAAA